MKFTKRPLFSFLVISLISINIFAQEYYDYNQLISKSKLLVFNDSVSYSKIDSINLYNSQLDYLDSAFNIENHNGFYEDYINAILISVKINKHNQTEKYFKELSKIGIKYNILKNEISLKDKYFKSKEFRKIKRAYKNNVKQVTKNHNKKMKRKVNKIIYRDQRHRLFKYKSDKQSVLDSLNVLEFDKLIADYKGLPTIENVGYIRATILQVPMLHLNPEDACRYANIYMNMYKQGLYSNINFIIEMLDQASYRNGAIFNYDGENFCIQTYSNKTFSKHPIYKQSFGYIDFWSSKERTSLIIPIYNINQSNSFMQQMGLLTLEERVKRKTSLKYDEKQFESIFGVY